MNAVGVHKKLFGLFLATVTVLTIMGVFIHLSLQDREAYRLVTHTYEVQTRLATTLLDVENGFDEHEEYRLNHKSDALRTFTVSFQKAYADLDLLERLVADDPYQSVRLHGLRHDIIAYCAALNISVKETTRPAGPSSPVQEYMLLERVHRTADSMKQAEQELLGQRTSANRTSQRRVNIALVCFLIMVSLLLVSLFLAVKQDLVQQQAVARLQQATDQRIARILENMSDAFVDIDRDWVVTYMNGQAEQLLWKTRAETIGANLWNLFPQIIDTEFEQHYRRAMEEQVTVRFEIYYPPCSTWYQITAYPNEAGLAIFFANVNERRKADEERESLTRREMLHIAAQRRNQELQDLARRLVEMQEAERRHLAFELHEEVGNVLAGLKLSLASVMKQQDEVRDKQIQVAQDLVTQLMRQVRALSLDLRPGVLDDLGLLPALEWYCRRYSEQTEIAVEFASTGLDTRLDGTVETTAYRIVQEALANAAHHPEVKSVEVCVTLMDERLNLQITICRGASVVQGAACFWDQSSLAGMQQRSALIGGALEAVQAPAGAGMMIRVSLPIHPIYTSLES
ncbi:MAG: domain S-box protein [Chthonomonadaceae bacterium]|nr:domain S-box protein [Chthonomonadaceae bacterium]